MWLLAAVAALAGCADPGTINLSATLPPGIAPGGAGTAYALQVTSLSTLVELPLANSGSVSASGTISLPATFTASAVAVDQSSGTIYVGGVDSNGNVSEVLAYSAGASGTAAPTRTITAQAGDFAQPLAMTVDSQGQLYIVSVVNITPTIAVFGASATGATAAVKSIAGGSTGIYIPTGIAVDTAGDIFVSDADPALTPFGGSILEFAATASGNAVPLGALTSTTQVFEGVAVDASGNIWSVQETESGSGVLSNPSIVEFAPGTTGASPKALKTIAGSSTSLAIVGGIQVDAKDNVYVTQQLSSGGDELLGFGPAASGNVAPDLILTPPAVTQGLGQFAVR